MSEILTQGGKDDERRGGFRAALHSAKIQNFAPKPALFLQLEGPLASSYFRLRGICWASGTPSFRICGRWKESKTGHVSQEDGTIQLFLYLSPPKKLNIYGVLVLLVFSISQREVSCLLILIVLSFKYCLLMTKKAHQFYTHFKYCFFMT